MHMAMPVMTAAAVSVILSLDLKSQPMRPVIESICLPVMLRSCLAVTVMLIRVIEAFKIVDLPNVMTAGGPGISTESMSLHSFFAWRSLDLGQSAAVAYLLLFVTVVICVSFFNLVVLGRMRQA